jgi:hypothetical protein
MILRIGRAGAVLGWLFTLWGIAYLALGGRDALTTTPGALPRLLVGLIAVVVGTSILRWARRAGPE